MAKTINPDMQIFSNERSARKYFDKHDDVKTLLKAGSNYFTDKKEATHPESAFQLWTNKYQLIDFKK